MSIELNAPTADAVDTGAASGAASGAALRAELVALLGAERVRTDLATRHLFSEDIWSASTTPVEVVISPTSVEALAAALAAAHRAGVAVAPRGAGMSYTSGYVPQAVRTVSLDLSRMDRIVAIDAADMTVTVEAGCTWSALHAALKAVGLRTPFWGPMSGLTSTIGGGISNLNAMLGAGQYGTSSESVVGLTVVLADGQVLRTGARAPGAVAPFYRFYGPDLCGLFCGDSGTFGVKAEITLRLIRNPAHEGFASFAFKSGRGLLDAMAEIARSGVASETCAFDPGLNRLRMQRASLGADLKTLGAVVGNEKSLVRGLLSAGRIALAGRDLAPVDEFPLHVIVDGRTAEGVQADVAEVRRIALSFGGSETENSVAKVIRALPFPPLNSVLGPKGERWIPVHGIAPLSKAADVFEAVEAVFASMATRFEAAGVTTGALFTTLSTNAVIVEPVLYWPEARSAIHAVAIEPTHLAKLPTLAANPAATAIVVEARERVIAAFESFGCAHFQIGRAYPYLKSRDAASRTLLETLKRALDADGRLNPGGLGLGGAARGA